MGDKGETSVNSCGPKEPRVGDKCGRQVGDKCKLMRPKAPRVRDKCGRHMEDKCGLGNKWETSVNSCSPKTPRVGDKCGRHVGDKCKLMQPKATQSGRQVCGRSGTPV